MPNAIMIVPFLDGRIQFPGLPEDEQVGFAAISYVPPPPGTAPYALVELRTSQANIDILTARADCLFLAKVTIDGYETTATTGPQRVSIRNKVATMGFTGAQYGLLVGAINASQTRTDLIYAIGTTVFFRNAKKDFMVNQDIDGSGLGDRS